jgi:hypothetical protein
LFGKNQLAKMKLLTSVAAVGNNFKILIALELKNLLDILSHQNTRLLNYFKKQANLPQ